MPRVPQIRAIFLDLDDTLCDTATAKRRRLAKAFAGGDVPLADWPTDLPVQSMVDDAISRNEIAAEHFPKVFARHGYDNQAFADHAASWALANRYHGLEYFDDALPTIQALRVLCEPALTIGVITNGPGEIQRPKVELLAVESLVDFTIVSGEFGTWKPDPLIFEEALRLAAVAPNEAIMVGDSLNHDIAGANAAGISSVWVNLSGAVAPSDGPQPDHVIRSIGELPEIVAPRCRR